MKLNLPSPQRQLDSAYRRHRLAAVAVVFLALAIAMVEETNGADDVTADVRPVRLPVVSASAARASVTNVPRSVNSASTKNPASTDVSAVRTLEPRFEPIRPTVASSSPLRNVVQQPSVPAPRSSGAWLGSSSATATQRTAAALLAEAQHEFDVKAYASAENTAWKALHQAARAVDLAARESGQRRSTSAGDRLVSARTAIREARDFAGSYATVDPSTVVRIIRSHQSGVLNEETARQLSAADAADRYLDHARVSLATIARESREAAQAMDLLAAIYLNRAAPSRLPGPTALCLRRAALQGQPYNASLACRLGQQLAAVGLLEEAKWALQHSLELRDDPAVSDALVDVLRRSGKNEAAQQMIAQRQQRSAARSIAARRPRMPQIMQLSPEQFAAVSQPMMPPSASSVQPSSQPSGARNDRTISRIAQAPQAAVSTDERSNNVASPDQRSTDGATVEEPGDETAAAGSSTIRRFFGSLRNVW